MPNVLDSSAVLAVLFEETGAEIVTNVLHDSIIGSVNACEVLRVLMRRGSSREQARMTFAQLRLPVMPFGGDDVLEAAALADANPKLGIGDCACIALARHLSAKEVLTGDSVWATLNLGVKVTLIR